MEVSAPVTPEGEWSEGPALLYVGKDLLLFYDKYMKHKYGAALSHDDGHTWEDVSDRIKMPEGMSHGTPIAVPYGGLPTENVHFTYYIGKSKIAFPGSRKASEEVLGRRIELLLQD